MLHMTKTSLDTDSKAVKSKSTEGHAEVSRWNAEAQAMLRRWDTAKWTWFITA